MNINDEKIVELTKEIAELIGIDTGMTMGIALERAVSDYISHGSHEMRYMDEDVIMLQDIVLPDQEMFYLQDTTSFLGNGMVFWKKNRAGYTSDLNKAELFTKDEVLKQNSIRGTDVGWAKSYIDSIEKTITVDVQLADRDKRIRNW